MSTHFFRILKATDNKNKFKITPVLLKEFKGRKDDFTNCCLIARRQPLTIEEQLELKTNVSFQADVYPVQVEIDTNQEHR